MEIGTHPKIEASQSAFIEKIRRRMKIASPERRALIEAETARLTERSRIPIAKVMTPDEWFQLESKSKERRRGTR